MDEELKGYLKDLDTIEEELDNWDFDLIEKKFQALHPGLRIAYFHDQAIRDDTVILHIWDHNDINYWVSIWTSDDPCYSEMIPNGKFVFSHDL